MLCSSSTTRIFSPGIAITSFSSSADRIRPPAPRQPRPPGSVTRAVVPAARARSEASSVPPCRSTIRCAIAQPETRYRPRLVVKNGWPTRGRSSAAMPGPSSSNSTIDLRRVPAPRQRTTSVAARRHRLERVDREVEPHLPHLLAIRLQRTHRPLRGLEAHRRCPAAQRGSRATRLAQLGQSVVELDRLERPGRARASSRAGRSRTG